MPSLRSHLRRRARASCESDKGGTGSSGGTAADNGSVQLQPDGLPRLPDHLDYSDDYAAELHCPVCSLDDGEAHEAGVPSHAASLTSAPPAVAMRTIDEQGLALLESLGRRKHPPSWWGKEYTKLQHGLAEVLESPAAHYLIIGLTFLDLAIVVTELILSSIFPLHDEAPHAVHTAEEALSWTSISILCIFTLELLAKLAVFGHTYYTHSKWHLFDAVVVIASLTLELSLRGIAQEVASLLIFFRLWRILRVMHGVAEAMELNRESEMEHHHRLVHGLQQDLALEHRRVLQLEREVAVLSAAAVGAGLDVAGILQLAAAAAQPDNMLLQADSEESASRSGGAGRGKGGRTGSSAGRVTVEEV